MFGSRKAEASKFRNTNQILSHENEGGALAEECVDNLPALELQYPSNGRNQEQTSRKTDTTPDQDVRAQMELAKHYSDQVHAPTIESPSEVEDPNGTRLFVGSSIKMKGDIEACGILQIEGHLEASAHSEELNVSESGTFIGDAVVTNADIRGRFEGGLTVRNKLVIRSAGIVAGTVKYGSIEIESGGKISGAIQELPQNDTQNDADSSGFAADRATAEATPENEPPQLNFSDFRHDKSDGVVTSDVSSS